MKIQFQFDENQRSLTLTPEDDLERMVLDHMADQCQKGSQLKLAKVRHFDYEIDKDPDFLIEMRVNGK